ncbi:MAG: hypothetical protein JNM56_03390 [Planctomycetia bacterium]|nr:hypothetical protein [Planctomycetia bacterium]
MDRPQGIAHQPHKRQPESHRGIAQGATEYQNSRQVTKGSAESCPAADLLRTNRLPTFEDRPRFTLPLATVEYLHQTTHLPVVVDPSHGTGKASLVSRMAVASVAAGADGLIIEVHPNPEMAMSDGFQALTPPVFRQMMADCRRVATAVDREM